MFGKDTILACRFDTGDGVRLTLKQNAVTKVEPADSASENTWLAPALFDPQINGFAGIDFQQIEFSEQDLEKAADGLRAAACGQFFFTLTTDEWPMMLERLNRARALREKSKKLQSAIAGWHIEGPFLSPEPGYHGAHDPAYMLDPTPEHISQLRAAAGSDPLLITVAPERPGAIDAITLAVSMNIRVSLGHTDASSAILSDAIKAGATGFTHLANGCPQKLDRHDNIVLRALEASALQLSMIPDAIHVSSSLFRVAHAAANQPRGAGVPPARICYTTDAMSAAGAPPGRYRLGKVETEVGVDQIVRMPGQTNFAGSALRPIDGVFRAAQMLNCSWRETWARASLTARRYAGITTKQEAMPFCLLNIEKNNFKSGQLFVDGERIDLSVTERQTNR